jgi:FkbM family methyltransferase
MLQRINDSIQQMYNFCFYKYLAATAEKQEYQLQELRAAGYCSQAGQDKWIINKLFPGKQKGTFVDIGANDGITFSNTFLLEKMGWNGLAVEPIPSVYEELVKNRRCITINGCVAQKSGRELFRVITGYPQMLSGLVDEYHPRHIERINSELSSHGGECKDIEVDCYNINELLEDNRIFQVDYLSIDVEGAEYKILNSIDFDRIHISVIGVENNYSDPGFPKLLIRKGFEFHSIVGDEFYLNRKIS